MAGKFEFLKYLEEGIYRLEKQLRFYESKFGKDNPIINKICKKKSQMLFHMKSKREMEEIFEAYTKVHDNGNEIVNTSPFHIPEEELLWWSLASLKAPLSHNATQRFEKLFQEVYGMQH